MRINPEILRHYWLDFSLHRTIMMPVILAIVFSIAVLIEAGSSSSDVIAQKLHVTAYLLFNVIVFLWGSYRASGTILTEINERTWDYQRLSSLSAWSLSWGTVFGSTLFIWYGAAICLAVLVISAAFIMPPLAIVYHVITLLVSGIFCHSVITLLGMQALQTSNRNKRHRTIGYRFLALVTGCIVWSIAQSITQLDGRITLPFMSIYLNEKDAYFYGLAIRYDVFVLLALFVFTFWALFGVYRCMRNELKMRTTPWGWTSFLLFLIFFWGGFTPPDINISTALLTGVFVGPVNIYLFFSIAFLISLVSCYAMFFSDNLSLIRYRMFFHHARSGNLGKAWQLVPRWSISFVFAIVTGLAVAIVALYNPGVGDKLTPALAVSALLLFLVRDLAILNLFSIASDNRRALIATLFYLSVLYGLLPMLTWSVGLNANVAFYALAVTNGWIELLPIIAQVIVVCLLVLLRWIGLNSTIVKTA